MVLTKHKLKLHRVFCTQLKFKIIKSINKLNITIFEHFRLRLLRKRKVNSVSVRNKQNKLINK